MPPVGHGDRAPCGRSPRCSHPGPGTAQTLTALHHPRRVLHGGPAATGGAGRAVSPVSAPGDPARAGLQGAVGLSSVIPGKAACCLWMRWHRSGERPSSWTSRVRATVVAWHRGPRVPPHQHLWCVPCVSHWQWGTESCSEPLVPLMQGLMYCTRGPRKSSVPPLAALPSHSVSEQGKGSPVPAGPGAQVAAGPPP